MKIWKQTKTLDGLINDLEIAKTKEGADVVLTGGKTVVLDEYPDLKGIFRCGVTRTGLPYKEAKKRSVKIGFPSDETANYIFEETADFTCYIIFRMFYGKVGTIEPWVKYSRTALVNKDLLVVGMGKIGSKVYDKMQNPFFGSELLHDHPKRSQSCLLRLSGLSQMSCGGPAPVGVLYFVASGRERERFFNFSEA